MVNVENGWVEFRFFRPQASSVSIAGDFNCWRENELMMTKLPDGYWLARMRLPQGEYKFRYCADGE
ncbi:MAG: hypothetical protein ACOC93_04825, partial [Planctomycetota bacterium]